MYRFSAVAAGLLLSVAAITACGKDATGPGEPVVTKLSCDDGTGNHFVACTLNLEQPAGFKVKLVSSSCRAHGNIFRITAPVQDTLLTDGCYETIGKEIIHAGPFPAGTNIAAEVIAPMLDNPPQLRVTGSYEEGWTLTYEDGEDTDFDDLVMVLTAIPQNPTP